jgi:ABC-type transport system involved in cytochrome bd biosynthesis fused ATPase/permease subunit
MGVALALWLIAWSAGAWHWPWRKPRAPHAMRRAQAIEALRARAVDLVAGQAELVMAGRIGASATADGRRHAPRQAPTSRSTSSSCAPASPTAAQAP